MTKLDKHGQISRRFWLYLPLFGRPVRKKQTIAYRMNRAGCWKQGKGADLKPG